MRARGQPTDRTDAIVGTEQLHREFAGWLHGYARMLDCRQADDAVQEAFAALTLRQQRPPPIDNPRGYLVRVVQRYSRQREKPMSWLLGRNSYFDQYDDPDLARAVSRLPRRQQECLALRYGHDLTIAAIAELLTISESTVKTHLSRALADLAKTIGPHQ